MLATKISCWTQFVCLPLNLPCVVCVEHRTLEISSRVIHCSTQTHNKIWLSALMKIDVDFKQCYIYTMKWALTVIWSDNSKNSLKQFTEISFIELIGWASTKMSIKFGVEDIKPFTFATFDGRDKISVNLCIIQRRETRVWLRKMTHKQRSRIKIQ